MLIGEISTHNVARIEPAASLRDAAQALRAADAPVLAIVEHDRLVGALSERDLALKVCEDGLDPATTAVSAVCNPDPAACTVDASLRRGLRLMKQHRQAWLLVLETDGGLAGCVTLGGLLDLIDRYLPDESTGPEPEYVHRVRGDQAD
jgi:CBS domain-containing protein